MVETSSQNNSAVASKSNNDCNSNKRARGTGKLSSRNTRRKRRDYKKYSAKQLNAPIPSFSCSPIIEDEEEVENEGLTSERGVAIEKVSKTIASAPNAQILDQTEINERIPHESTKEVVEGAVDGQSYNVSAAKGNLLQNDNARATSKSSAETLNDDSIDGSNAANDEPIMNAQKKVNETPPVTDLIKEINKLSATAPISTRDPPKDQTSQTRKKVYDMVEIVKPEKRCMTSRSTTETIEILDDDDDEQAGKGKEVPLVSRTNSVNIDTKEKVPTKSKVHSRKRKRLETDLIAVDSSDDESVSVTKKTKTTAQKKKPARRKTTAAKNKSESNKVTDESGNGTQKHRRKKLCATCATCKCQAKDDSATIPQKLAPLSLSGSDARVEQTLKNRLLKIERSIAWSESQRHECARELKRHRGTLQKKFSKTGTNKDKRQHFLADAQVSEEMAQAFATARIDRKDVKKVKTRVFGRSSKNEPQPTLTQMFGGGDENDEGNSDDDSAANEDNQPCSGDASSEEESSRTDLHDSLSFWNDTSVHATHQFIGSMTQFNEATIRFKDKQAHSTSTWTKATSNMINHEVKSESNEEEEGIGALVELFDLSPKKKPASFSSHDEEYSDNCLQSQLSQAGAIAAQSIKEEIANDEEKRVAIERLCPNWRENVEYSFRRKDSEGLEYALNQVKEERQRLLDAKDRILRAFLERSSTLDAYEMAIEGSLKRLAEKENDNT